MSISPRTYRLIASALSVVLLLSTTLPLVLQVCCVESMTASAEVPCHNDMTGSMPDHVMLAGSTQMPMSHNSTSLQVDCCVLQSARTPITESRTLAEVSSRLVSPLLQVAFSALSPPAQTVQPRIVLADASPPAAPLSLHLLHGSFLN